MRLIVGLALLLVAASDASAQAALDWRDGGALVMPTADLDGDTFPAGTTVRCVVDLAGGQIIVNSTVGQTVAIAASAVPKSSTAQATASAACTTPLSSESGAIATQLVLLRPWRGPRAPALQP